MKKLIAITALLLAIFLVSVADAASSDAFVTDQATVKLVAGGYNEDGKLALGLHYKLKPGWRIYWRSAGDTGFPPQLNWNGSINIENTNMLWPAPKRSRYKIKDNLYSESYEYKGETLFPIILTPKDNTKQVNIKLHVNYAICAEICIPQETNLNLTIPAAYHSAKMMDFIASYTDRVPKQNGSYGIDIQKVSLVNGSSTLQILASSSSNSLEGSDIFIENGEAVAFYNPEISLYKNGREAIFRAPITFLTNNKSLKDKEITITLVRDNQAVEKTIATNAIAVAENEYHISKYTLAIILLFGFIGGLILNIMPCVLPVLSIKLMGVIKYGGGSKGHVAVSFVTTALGIILSFIALAVMVVQLKSIGMNVGWGFHFQEPIFIIALVVILTSFAANMWGFYEFRLPVGLGGLAYKGTEKHSLLGHFLTGVFATLLATPCTAPFLGTAVGFALSRGTFEIISTFTAMGVGMALPYLFFSVFPGMVTMLPKPGEWMITVKRIMGWLLAATAVWLIWVLSNQLGTLAAWLLLILSILKLIKLWAANHIKFLAKRSVRFSVLGLIILLAFIVPLKVGNNGFQKQISSEDIWENFKPNHISALVENGKVVFIDVTADWCLTCKVNKLLVLDDLDIIGEFTKIDVVAMQADWTNKDNDIADYLLTHDRVGVPFNVVYGPGAPEGIILSEILTKGAVIKAIRKASNQKNQ